MTTDYEKLMFLHKLIGVWRDVAGVDGPTELRLIAEYLTARTEVQNLLTKIKEMPPLYPPCEDETSGCECNGNLPHSE
jgi:hypothetical protein